MNITKQQLVQAIKEEIEKVIGEVVAPGALPGRRRGTLGKALAPSLAKTKDIMSQADYKRLGGDYQRDGTKGKGFVGRAVDRIKASTKKKVAIADFAGMSANQPEASPTGQTDYVWQRASSPAGGSQANYGDPSAGRRRSQDTDTVGPRKWKGSEYPPPKKTSTDALGAFKALKKRAKAIRPVATPAQIAKADAKKAANVARTSTLTGHAAAGATGGGPVHSPEGGVFPSKAGMKYLQNLEEKKVTKKQLKQAIKEWASFEDDQKLFENWRRFTKE